MNNTLIAVDLAKDIFEIAVSQRSGKVGECYRPRRAKLLVFFAQRPKATVIMEASKTQPGTEPLSRSMTL